MECNNRSLAGKVPLRIARLEELAYNFWWSWHRSARELFKSLDYALWRSTAHNPVCMLNQVSEERLKEVGKDPLFRRHYDAVMIDFDRDLKNGHLWYPKTYPDLADQTVAYFSLEFGIHSSLPIYSGGLGVLAGDHIKEASDLGLPLVAVGFLYEMGYFRQRVNGDGWQEATYPRFEPRDVAVREIRDDAGNCLFVPVEVGDRTVNLQVWHVQAGRTQLYLMDADNEQNAPWDRELTARLYGGDQEMRIQQEIVIGLGGLRILRTLGIDPAVFHLNEGHSAFLVLERIRGLVATGKTYQEAAEIVRDTTVFTTHTPVAAGHDVFPFHLVEKYFSNYWPRLGLDRDAFLALGSDGAGWQGFNMTLLALRMAGQSNGVSRLHGQVSRKMWQPAWPDLAVEQVPIGEITNGVHLSSWVGQPIDRVFRKHLGPQWLDEQDSPALWERVLEVPEEELWAAHVGLKQKLLTLIRERARRARVDGRMTPEQVLCAGTLLDPEALVIGFARRFATYKRATLIFSDVDRLRRLLHDPYRPVQFVFSGKAHPADDAAKHVLQQIYQLAKDPATGGRIAFIEDYDMQVARYLVQGVDLWLNTPLHPHEASGTSGQKAALNGVPSLSVLDGWWAEGYDGSNGWAIEPVRRYSAEEWWLRDQEEAEQLYGLLENEVVPLFYQRDGDGVPRGWVHMMREAIRTIGSSFSARRMLKDYSEKMYVPAARRAKGLG